MLWIIVIISVLIPSILYWTHELKGLICGLVLLVVAQLGVLGLVIIGKHKNKKGE